MKKQSIALIALLIIASGLYGVTASDLVKNLEFYCSDTFGKEYIFEKMQFSPLLWNNTIDEIGTVVTEKSKNLMGSKDSALTSTFTEIKNANTDLLDVVRAIQMVYPSKNKAALQGQLGPIRDIVERMENIQSKISQMSFTLANKKEAQDLLTNAASYIGKAATKVRLNLLAQINRI